MRILVVVGDKEYRTFLQRGLSGEGFAVDVAADGHAALKLAHRISYDALLLNTHLPDLSGLSLVSLLRKERYPAVMILLSPQLDDRQKLEAFDVGAEDFLVKPPLREIVARLHIHLRPPRTFDLDALNPTELVLGDLRMNLLTRRVQCAGKEVRLTRKESELLEFLMRHPDHVHSPSVIAQELWNIEFDGHTNAVERHICRLRAKLEASDHRIETLRGFGYRLAA